MIKYNVIRYDVTKHDVIEHDVIEYNERYFFTIIIINTIIFVLFTCKCLCLFLFS